MKQNNRRSFSIVYLVLIVFLALPSFIQLLHVANHLENNCPKAYESHIHIKELDCDFNKFNFSHQFKHRIRILCYTKKGHLKDL